MPPTRPARLVLAGLAAVGAALWLADAARPQKPAAPAKRLAPDVLKPEPRPKRPELPPSALPLAFLKGERVALVGNSLAERMGLFGHFETLLHARFPERELRVRNFGRPADEVAVRQRSADYTALDDPQRAFGADTYLCLFGFNESFAGPGGVEKFKQDYNRFLDEYANKYPRDDAGSKPRFVIVSPVAFEPTGDPFLPDGSAANANLKLYAAAAGEVAAARKLAFVDLFTPTLEPFAKQPGMQFTINGCHLNEAGDREVGRLLDLALFGPHPTAAASPGAFEKLRAAVVEKAWYHNQDHRMVNGWYVYGGRRTFDTETFPLEYAKLRAQVAARDRYVWDIAAGRPVPDKPDDSATGALYTPPTRFGSPGQKYSEADSLRYLAPPDFIASAKVPPGMEIKLFADETRFPQLAKPVQLNFDNKGRLWAACMPSYPQWKPGDAPPNDRLLIFEDSDNDGSADACKVFYDKLHCPTGFEFWNGGVLVVDQPRLLFLKDTDGDDKADLVVHLQDGWATDDTHHTLGAFEWSHTGQLHMLEGIATSTTVETPRGPLRNQGAGGAYVMDPRTGVIRNFALPGQYNSWCYVFDEWGNGIVGDGTTANQHWDTPLSGAPTGGRRGLNTVFNNEGMRPALGSEFLVSRALPKEVQGQFAYACVINMNGMPRFTVRDDGSGFAGERIKQNGQPDDLIRSPDKHFRPADPQIGPDGALWFGDWANALIGHMQYSQRDPNRDHTRGRIYRLVGKGLPAVTPATQFGKPAAEILEQLREPEWRTRYRARRELRDRPLAEVSAALAPWLASIKADDPARERLRCEALWLQASHRHIDRNLLASVLKSPEPKARAAAARVVADFRDIVPEALALLKAAAGDDAPRVRVEAVRGLSLYDAPDAVEAVLSVTTKPMDYWLRYTVEHALSAREDVWRQGFVTGTVAKGNAVGQEILTELLNSSRLGGAAAPFLRVVLDTSPKPAEVKNKAMTALAGLRGNPSNGRAVFARNCVACHKVGNGEGQDYGPNLAGLATRQPMRYKIVESVVEPNAEVDQKYLSTKITTDDDKLITGLLVSENDKEVVIFDGKDKKVIPKASIESRETLKQSSMPEGLAGTMAPTEFVDLIEYLGGLK